MTQLMLKRASISRLSGEWNEDDYDVDGAVVGRIMKAATVPVGQSWMFGCALSFFCRTRRYGPFFLFPFLTVEDLVIFHAVWPLVVRTLRRALNPKLDPLKRSCDSAAMLSS